MNMMAVFQIIRQCRVRQALLLALLCAAISGAYAQTTGVISGVVTDKGGALIAGVKVAARNVSSGEIRVATTNQAGAYSFPALAPGDYALTFDMRGFATVVETATLNITEHIAINAVLPVSSVVSTVQVTSAEPLLQTESVTEGRVIDGVSTRELPLATNNFTQLLALSPGASGVLNDATALGRGTQNIFSNGARANSNSIYIDGIDAVNVHVNSAANNTFASNGTIIPPTEAIQELKVQTALFDALTGRSGGSNIAVITRSGSDQWHSSLYEFFRNDFLNANSYFLNQTGSRRPELKQNQFGGTVGGPILPHKVFFFFSYQGTRQVNGYAGQSSIVLPQIPQDRSLASLGAFGSTLGKTSHSGPTINANGSNISPVAEALLNLKFANGQYVIPSPQLSTTSGVNYAVSTPSTFDEDEYTGSVDYQISATDHLAFHEVIAQQPQFQSVESVRFLPGFGLNQFFKSRLYSLAETHIFSPNVVNEARMGISRLIGTTGFQNVFDLSSIGMTRFNSADFPDIPLIELSGSMELGYSVNDDQADTETTWQYFDNLSWLKGRHNMNFGVEMRRYQDNYYSNNEMRGSIDIISFQNFLLGLSGAPTAQGGNGTGYSDIYETHVASGVVQRYDRLRDVALFAQDSWKPLLRLTINTGMRWEYLGMPTDIYGRDGAFYPNLYQAPAPGLYTSLGFVQAGNARNPVPGIARVSNTLTNTVNKLNFGPRVGIAYQMRRNMVLRTGYGIYYDRLSNQLGLLESLSLPNFVESTEVNTGGSTTQLNQAGSLANPFPTLPLRSQFPIVPVLYSPTAPNAPALISMNDIDPAIRTPYYQQYGLNVQTQFMRGLMLEVGYVGARGLHLPVETEINQAELASATNPINGQTSNTASAASRAPYLGFSNNGLLFLQTNTISNYNSLQATLTERLHAAEFLATYTYAKTLDTASGSSDAAVFNNLSGDQSNPAQAYGPADYDRRQRLAGRFVQPLPTPRWRIAQGKVGSRIFGGYAFSGTGIIQSGLPFSITNSGGAAYYGTDTSRGSFAPGATVATAIKKGKTESRLNEYFNTAAFAQAGDYYGNTGRNILRGPLNRVLDLSLNKRTLIRDGVIAEFRAQAFNLTNTPNFANPASDVGTTSTFGVISSTVGNPRILQFALKLSF